MHSVFSRLAVTFSKAPRAGLLLGFALPGGAALGLLMFGANTHHDVLVRVGGVTAVILGVLLLAVVTWYRRESVVSSAIVLALAWTFARVIGLGFGTLMLSKSLGAVGYLMLGVFLGLPLSMLEALVIGGILVAGLRRIRPRGAPLAIDGTRQP